MLRNLNSNLSSVSTTTKQKDKDEVCVKRHSSRLQNNNLGPSTVPVMVSTIHSKVLDSRPQKHNNEGNDDDIPLLASQTSSMSSSDNSSCSAFGSSSTSSASSYNSKLKRSGTSLLETIEKGSERKLSSDDDNHQSGANDTAMITKEEAVVDINHEKEGKNDSAQKRKKRTEIDVDKYMASREMTPLQERMNAVTIIPGALYCFLFLASGAWLEQAFQNKDIGDIMVNLSTQDLDESKCISSSWFPDLHAMPPLPALALGVGMIIHAPFSFLYHWRYAHRLPPGLARTTHWSRRMDHVMIHACSAFTAYATSGRFDYFMVNVLYNIECMLRQLEVEVKPRRNQGRIFISVVAYTLPILKRGEFLVFSQVWLLFACGFWLFGMYPIGGWSHSAFHIVLAFLPPMLMSFSLELPASQDQLKIAAGCALLGNQSLQA